MSSRALIIALSTVCLLGTTAVAQPAFARDRSVEGQVTGKNGKTATVTDTAHREKGLQTRNTTVTGPNGGTTTRNVNRNWDKEAGTYGGSRTVTGPDGKSSSVTTSANRNATGGVDVSKTVTGREGESRTWSGTVTGGK